MTHNYTPKSIRDLDPLECGAVWARQGLGFQDHVATGYCIDMVSDPTLIEVWCDSQDDITLIWNDGSGDSAEFVQVKSDEPDQLWSVAMLCHRESKAKNTKGLGTSILEKSLAYDRCLEPCRFRIVTARPVNQELEILTYALESAHRSSSAKILQALGVEMSKSVGDFRSANGRCCKEWAGLCTWHVKHSAEDVRNANLIKLMRIAKQWGSILFPDQAEDIYNKLSFMVQNAARAKHADAPGAKRILRDLVIAWLRQEISRLEHPVAPGTGTVLKDKMRQAGIPDDVIENALEQRQHYRIDALTPHYQENNRRRTVERGVAAALHLMLGKFDAGQLGDSGVAFHTACLETLSSLPETLAVSPKPEMDFVFGCMYNITDRCGHRFRRATG